MKIIKTANYKKISFDIDDKKELAYELMEWHGGMSSPLYGISSSWLAGKNVPVELIEEGVNELEELIEGKVNYPGEMSRRSIFELRNLQGRLKDILLNIKDTTELSTSDSINDNLLNPEADKTNMEFVQKNIDTNFKNRGPIDPNKVR